MVESLEENVAWMPRALRSIAASAASYRRNNIFMEFTISAFENERHRDQVVRLWERVFGYEAAHNNPIIVIDRKLAVSDGLFFVAVSEGVVLGTIMAGYDGHRGWIYSLAVHPDHRRQRIGSQLLSCAERHLVSQGCVKINLQIMDGNENVQGFYEANGYTAEKRISMGKNCWCE